MTDKEAESLISGGNGIGLTAIPDGTVETVGIVRKVKDIVKSVTVATKPMRGG